MKKAQRKEIQEKTLQELLGQLDFGLAEDGTVTLAMVGTREQAAELHSPERPAADHAPRTPI